MSDESSGDNNSSGDDKKPPLGTGGTQTTSTTVYKGPKGRLDVENPAPGKRPGQIHFQSGREKYLYDVETGQFRDAPNRINELLKDPEIQRGIQKGLKYLGVQ